jgi:hypothetical protein
MPKYDRTMIELQFPPAPRVSDRPEKQQEFEQWYSNHSQAVRRQFDDLAAVIDTLSAKVDALSKST